MTRSHIAAALVLLSALALTACAPEPAAAPAAKAESSDPEPAPPVVDLDAAVEAADALILEYWDAVDEAYRSNGERVDALERVAIPSIAQEEIAVAHLFTENELTLIGDYTARDTEFAQLFVDNDTLYLVVTTCVDYSKTHTVDLEGNRHPVNRDLPRGINEVFFEVGDPEAFDDLRVAAWDDWQDAPC